MTSQLPLSIIIVMQDRDVDCNLHFRIGFAGEASPRHIIPSYNVKRNNEVSLFVC